MGLFQPHIFFNFCDKTFAYFLASVKCGRITSSVFLINYMTSCLSNDPPAIGKNQFIQFTRFH
nr:MAG TPA: hypothetical protein [Caudoviricetes sp.]